MKPNFRPIKSNPANRRQRRARLAFGENSDKGKPRLNPRYMVVILLAENEGSLSL
jgi:hypothetical protein